MNAFLHPDEIEEMNWNPVTEHQAAFHGAQVWMAARQAEVETTGVGEIVVEIRHAYYCKATDAFAGMMLAARHRVATREEAGEWVATNWPSHGDEDDPQVDIIVPEHMLAPIIAFVPPAPAFIDDDGVIPF